MPPPSDEPTQPGLTAAPTLRAGEGLDEDSLFEQAPGAEEVTVVDEMIQAGEVTTPSRNPNLPLDSQMSDAPDSPEPLD